MKEENILIVDDEPEILELMEYHLKKNQYQVYQTSTGREAMDILHETPMDLVILDILLPETHGTEICRRIREDERLTNIPVMFVTGRTDEMDELHGFSLGADDYIKKPFSPRVLISRMEAVLNRTRGNRSFYQLEDLHVYFDRHQVKIKEERLNLSPREFAVLTTLIRFKPRTINRSSLLERAWGMDSNSSPRSVDIVVTRIRSKLGVYSKHIRTVTGYGYQWDEEVED